jgi:hypothetical protein
MAKASARSTAEIQRLLEEKQRIEQWLERLQAAVDKTPKHVRDRVSNDYRNRLEGVVAQLQSYQDELASALHAQLATREQLREQEAQAAERLSEAELRHAVGEYGESRWGELRTEILESLVQVRENLKVVEREINTLEGVVSLLEPGRGAVGAFGDEEELEGTAEVGEGAAAPMESASAAGGDEERGQTDAFDELAFLKSVTGETEAPDAADLSRHADAGDLPLGAEGVKSVRAGDRQSGRTAAKKTLKCVECGTMNLPTEWYCERCGAELAAL